LGQKLLDYYEKAQQIGGITARMRLAVLTKLPSNKAESAPDSLENIQIFETAINQIKSEMG
jgi:hypothetical protein